MKKYPGSHLMSKLPMMLSCQQTQSFLDDYLSDNLTSAQRLKFELHLKMCSDCVTYLDGYKASIELGKQHFYDDCQSDEIPDQLVEAILAAKEKKE